MQPQTPVLPVRSVRAVALAFLMLLVGLNAMASEVRPCYQAATHATAHPGIDGAILKSGFVSELFYDGGWLQTVRPASVVRDSTIADDPGACRSSEDCGIGSPEWWSTLIGHAAMLIVQLREYAALLADYLLTALRGIEEQGPGYPVNVCPAPGPSPSPSPEPHMALLA